VGTTSVHTEVEQIFLLYIGMYRGCSLLYDLGIKKPILMDRTLAGGLPLAHCLFCSCPLCRTEMSTRNWKQLSENFHYDWIFSDEGGCSGSQKEWKRRHTQRHVRSGAHAHTQPTLWHTLIGLSLCWHYAVDVPHSGHALAGIEWMFLLSLNEFDNHTNHCGDLFAIVFIN